MQGFSGDRNEAGFPKTQLGATRRDRLQIVAPKNIVFRHILIVTAQLALEQAAISIPFLI